LLFDLPDLDEEFFLPGTGPDLDKWNVTDCTRQAKESYRKNVSRNSSATEKKQFQLLWPERAGLYTLVLDAGNVERQAPN
jgi:hypothetical protein